MPYDKVSQLPANVRKLSPKKRRQWMHVWNSAYSRCKDKGGSDKKCEGSAFAQANGVVVSKKNTESSDLAQAAESPHFFQRLYALVKERAAAGDISLDDLKSIVSEARAHAGGKAKAEVSKAECVAEAGPETANEVTDNGRILITIEGHEECCGPVYFEEALDNAMAGDLEKVVDTEYTGFLVAIDLPDDVKAKLAIDDGEAAEDLHITVCYLGDSADFSTLQIAKVLVAVEQLAQYSTPLSGKVSGMLRFEDVSDGMDAFAASVDVPGLSDFRQRIFDTLRWQGVKPSSEHDFVPHITLKYLDPAEEWPLTSIEQVPLLVDTISVFIGNQRIALPLGGQGDMLPSQYYSDATQEVTELCASDPKEKDRAHTRLFMALPKKFMEAPEWITYLPTPGTYKHPVYGLIKLTSERNQNFVDNFNNAVYQKTIPIDAEHETKLSGAVGWIVKMRLTESGSVEAQVEWTDRGLTFLEKDRFAYFSPEWYDEWEDAATQQVHSDIAVGGALCTRPFFKSLALDQKLVATEHGILTSDDLPDSETPPEPHEVAPPVRQPEGSEAVGDQAATGAVAEQEREETPEVETEQPAPREPQGAPERDEPAERPAGGQTGPTGEGMQMSEDAARRFAEMQADMKRMSEKLTAQEEQLRKATAVIAGMEGDARTKRFTDVVMGVGDGKHRWFGEAKDHVSYLVKMAEAFGEDSDEVKHYIQLNDAHAAQLAQSALMSERGTSGGTAFGAGASAWAKIEAKAREFKATEDAAGRSVTLPQAIDQVTEREPELYNEYLTEKSGVR